MAPIACNVALLGVLKERRDREAIHCHDAGLVASQLDAVLAAAG